MLVFNSISEIDRVKYPSVVQFQEAIETDIIKDTPDANLDDYNNTMGGKLHIIEKAEEWSELLEKVPCVNDHYIFDNIFETFDELYMVVYIATNDAGGPLYYIPRQIYMQEGKLCSYAE